MIAVIIAILVMVFLAGCANEGSSPITVRMEVGYPMLAGIAGSERVWAVYRLRLDVSEKVTSGDSIVASLRCAKAGCSVSRIDPKSGSRVPSVGPELFGRIIQVSQDRREAILIFEPFPIEVSTEVFDQLKFRPEQTSLLEVEYVQTDHGLVLKEMRPAGIARKQAIRWK